MSHALLANCPLSSQQSAAINKAVEALKLAKSIGIQQAIIVEAVAGSGKTYTLKALMRVLKSLYPELRICYLVFGKKNQISASQEIPASLASVSTFHSKGFTSFSRALSPKRANTDSRKVGDLLSAMNIPFFLWSTVKTLTSLAKARALHGTELNRDNLLDIIEHFGLTNMLLEADTDYSLEQLIDQAIDWTFKAVAESNRLSYQGKLDFDDQLYMTVIDGHCLSDACDKFDVVLIDEAQDTSKVRRELAAKLLAKDGLLVAVGDRYQAIFGFTGADNDSLDQIQQQFNAAVMPLSITYRCPKSHVEFAKSFIPHCAIEADSSAPNGQLLKMSLSEMMKLAFNPTDFILCRNNKPLLEIVFSLLARGIACQIVGKSIAEGLIRLTKKWKRVKTLEALEKKLGEFLADQSTKLIAKGNEGAADSLRDQIDCMFLLIQELPAGSGLDDLRNKINGMFVDENGELKKVVTLMTCHKAKGLESDRVFWIGRSKFQPSKMARKDWEKQQEIHLMYVAATRSRDVLVDVSL